MPFLLILFFATLPFQFALSPVPGIDLHISRLLAIGLFGFWITRSLFQKKLFIPARTETMLLVSFLFFSSFALFFAENVSWGFRKLAFLLSFVPLFFVAFPVFRDEQSRERFAKWLVAGSALSAIVGILQFLLPFAIGLDPAMLLWQRNILPVFSGITFSGVVSEFSSMVANVDGRNVLRASGFFPDPHIASFFWGMTLPLALTLAALSKSHAKIVFYTVSIFIFVADILTFSRGGYLALIVALIISLIFFFPLIIKKYAPIFLFLLFLLLAFVTVPNPISSRMLSSFDPADHSTSGRLSIWKEATDIIAEHPLVGVGLGNYSNEVKPSANYREPRYAHNIFLDIAAETGVINGIVFFLLLALPIARAFKSPSEHLTFATGFSLLIFSVHSLFETPLYSVHILPLFLALIACILAPSEAKPPKKPDPQMWRPRVIAPSAYSFSEEISGQGILLPHLFQKNLSSLRGRANENHPPWSMPFRSWQKPSLHRQKPKSKNFHAIPFQTLFSSSSCPPRDLWCRNRSDREKLRAETREREARDRTLSLESALPSLVSQFNLAIGTPGVQFFEEEAGIEKTLEDSLASREIIYTYADIEAVMKYIPDINTRYVAKRERLGIDKKALLLDNPFAREYMKTYHRLVTDVKLIPPLRDVAPFHSVMEVYAGKISYITFEESRMIGVIIDNRAIFDMHKYLFEYLWNLAPAYEQKAPAPLPVENKKDSAEEAL